MTSLVKLSHEWYLATALYDAIDDGNLREVAILVQEKHANPNVVVPDYGITPFHLAVGHENEYFAKEVTKLLLKNGGDPDVIGADGLTPLHVAVAWNRAAVVRILLSYGGDPWMKDENEKNSFHHAHEEHAWDALKTLDIYRRMKHLKCDDEEKNYKIHLDKVIIHSKDVQAEFKAQCDSCLKDLPESRQSVATQTPFPFAKVQLAESDNVDSDEFESVNSGPGRSVFDSCFDWCDKSNDVVIPDNCRRKIVLHRAKTRTYEYRPKLSIAGNMERSDRESKTKYFRPVCCAGKDVTKSLDCSGGECMERGHSSFMFENVIRDSYGAKEKSIDVPLSEDSIISLDCSNRKSPDEPRFLEAAKDIPFIDESMSDVGSHCDASQGTEEKKPKSEMDSPQKSGSSEMALAPARKENLKHVSWSGCLSTCACIPKRTEDDSFMAYSATSKKTDEKPVKSAKTTMLSGVDVLPDTVVDELKLASGDAKSMKELESSGDISPKDSGNISIEYKYTDDEDGIEFIAAKMPFSNSSNRAKIKNNNEDSEISDPGAYDTDYIRKELKKLGFISGPMCGTPTKKLYLRKLRRIRKTVSSPVMNLIKPQFSSELEQVLRADTNWVETLSKWSHLEKELREHFLDTSLSSTWRTGTAKTSFIYLLLDPRVSNNLPARCEDMNLIDVWRTFVRSIFYIGKGTRARPYEHLHEAFSIWRETQAYWRRRCNLKVSYILEIWKEGLGVVCVQTFHNLIPAEAYTREAAMIDAVGVAKLKNEKGGMYYGVATTWNSKIKRRLGAVLLYRAMRLFIADNEIQLKPTDVN